MKWEVGDYFILYNKIHLMTGVNPNQAYQFVSLGSCGRVHRWYKETIQDHAKKLPKTCNYLFDME